MAEGADAQTVQPLFKGLHLGGGGVLGHAHAAHIQPHLLKSVDEAQHVQIVGNAVVAAHLAADDILSTDDDDDLGLLLELQQHLQLGVRLKAGQHAGGVVIVEQLAAEFQIQLIVKLLDALADMLRLHRKIFVVVKSYFHRSLPLWRPGTPYRALNHKHKYTTARDGVQCKTKHEMQFRQDMPFWAVSCPVFCENGACAKRARPLRRLRASSPKGRALGNPRKLHLFAKASPF